MPARLGSMSRRGWYYFASIRGGPCRMGAIISPRAAFAALSLRLKSEGRLEPLRIGRPHPRVDDPRRALAVERHDELLGGDAAHVGARCGDAITLSNCNSGCSAAGGSLSHTSTPAPAIFFARSASTSARSSWMKPRAVVMK